MKKNLLSALIALLFTLTLSAQWTNNTLLNTCISDTTGRQEVPLLSFDYQAETGYISWLSSPYIIDFQLYLNSIDKNGILKWGNEGICVSNEETFDWCTFYGLTIDDENCAVLINHDVRNGFSNAYAYRISPDGEFLWGENGLQLTNNSCSDIFNVSLSTIQDYNRDYLFGWTIDSALLDTLAKTWIRIEKVRKDMSHVWEAPVVIKNDSINYDKRYFDFILKPDNGFYLIFYGVTLPDTTGLGNMGYCNLYVQNVSSDGAFLWDNPIALDQDSLLSGDFMIDAQSFLANDHGLIVVWFSIEGHNTKIKIQHLDQDGSKYFGDHGLYVSENYGHSLSCFESTYDTINELCYIFWNDNFYYEPLLASFNNLKGQKINKEGFRMWSDTGLQIKTWVSDTSYLLGGVSTHPNGDILVFYANDYTYYGSNRAFKSNFLSACRLNPEGNFVWTPEHLTVSDTITNKSDYFLSDYINGEWIAVWSDGRKKPDSVNFCCGIYAQNIIEDGTLGPLYIVNPQAENNDILNIYPNPFSVETNIQFNLYHVDHVRCYIYNSRGAFIKQAFSALFPKGKNTVRFMRENLKPGIYFVEITTNTSKFFEKVVIL